MALPVSFFNHDAQAGGFYPQAHVGFDVVGIGNRQNTLIEGIRGTGKTHILKMIQRYHLENFSKTKVLPIYVSLAQLSEYVKRDPDEFRVQLYARIVDASIETLEANSGFVNEEQSIISEAVTGMKRALGLESTPTFSDFTSEIVRIRQCAEELLYQLSYDLTAQNLKASSTSSDKNTDKISLLAKVSGMLFSGSVSGSKFTEHQASEASEGTVHLLGSRLVHNNAAEFIIKFLQEIQKIIDLEYSLILLDECSEASAEAQIEIFRFFKAVRGCTSAIAGKDECAFFVGTVYPRGETNYPDRQTYGFSFEPGQDCTVEFIQWDETDVESYSEFFEKMLVNRARAILDFEGNIRDFIKLHFEDDSTFRLAIFCANGIPRRFWELVRRAYDSGTNKISKNRLKIASQEIVSDQILSHHYLDEGDQAVVQYIIKIIAQRNEETRVKNKKSGGKILPQGVYFSILPRNVEKLYRLIMQGAVHDKSRMKARRQSLRPHPVYALDVAVAYAFRAIPERDFEKVAARDFSRAPANGFANAASFEPPRQSRKAGKAWPKMPNTVAPPGDKLELVKPLEESSEEAEHFGFIGHIRDNGSGSVTVNDGGPFGYIPKKLMTKLKDQGVELGTQVKVLLQTNPKGREVLQIETLEGQVVELTKTRRIEIISIIDELLNESERVMLTKVAVRLRSHFGDVITGSVWFGYGRMYKLLQDLEVTHWHIDTSSANAFVTKKNRKYESDNDVGHRDQVL